MSPGPGTDRTRPGHGSARRQPARAVALVVVRLGSTERLGGGGEASGTGRAGCSDAHAAASARWETRVRAADTEITAPTGRRRGCSSWRSSATRSPLDGGIDDASHAHLRRRALLLTSTACARGAGRVDSGMYPARTTPAKSTPHPAWRCQARPGPEPASRDLTHAISKIAPAAHPNDGDGPQPVMSRRSYLTRTIFTDDSSVGAKNGPPGAVEPELDQAEPASRACPARKCRERDPRAACLAVHAAAVPARRGGPR